MEETSEGTVLHLLVVEAELFKDGGVEVAVVMRILDGFVAIFVCRTVDGAAFDASASKPRGVALGVVITAGSILRPGAAAEFAGEDDESAI